MNGTTAKLDPAGSPAANQPALTEVCPHFHAAIELIGKRWSGAIIWALVEGPLRYAELKRAIPGLSDRLLSQRLRELEEAGLMARAVEDGMPAKVTYRLTEKGIALKPAILELRQWACQWQDEPLP
ncbi:MAG: helix-turn-helix domain-containing protein [Solirubrobacterales bacterium]